MIALRSFTDADVPLGMALKDEAGWNQLPGDWRRLLALEPDGGFVAEWDGRPAGTVLVALFDDVAWISMMLVQAALRGRGIGRALMRRAIAFAESRGATAIRLDATPLGRPLYETLGFRADFSLVRYAGAPQKPRGCTPAESLGASSTQTARVQPRGFEEIVDLDRAVTHTNRRKLLELFDRERPMCAAVQDGTIRGYIASRPGSKAAQIGPCIADDERGPALLSHAFGEWVGQPVLIDLSAEHAAAIAVAAEHGLAQTRELLRMTRGEFAVERTECLWASAGPEKG
jgi:GNAT superfamily N-acetyltransferase